MAKESSSPIPNKDFTLKPLAEVFPGNPPKVGEGISEVSLADGDKLFAFFPVAGLPTVKWYVGLAIDKDKAYASLTEFRRTAVITTIIAVVVVLILLGLVIQRLVSRPVIGMTNAMKRLAEGDKAVDDPRRRPPR